MNQLNIVKDRMVQNLDNLLDREEKIQLLVQRTDSMRSLSTHMRKKVQPFNPLLSF